MFVASTPLAGGISMMGETCVALLGGLQAVRLATGSENIEDEDALVSSMIAGYRFYLKFLTKMESSCCLEIEMARSSWFCSLSFSFLASSMKSLAMDPPPTTTTS